MKKILRPLVSIGLLMAAFYLLDWQVLLSALKDLDPWLLLAVTLIMLAEFPILGFRWYRIVNDVAPLSISEHSRRYMVATFLNSFTPAQIAGDVYRYVSLKETSQSKGSLLALLLQERVIGLLGFFVFFLLCLAGEGLWNDRGLGGVHETFLYAGTLFLAALLLYPLVSPVLKAVQGGNSLQSMPWAGDFVSFCLKIAQLGGPKRTAELILLSLPGGIIWTLGVLLVTHDQDIHLSFFTIGLIATLVDLIRLIPVTVQGIGVREASFAYFFSLYGHSPEQGFIVGAVSYAAMSVAMVVAGIIGKAMPVKET